MANSLGGAVAATAGGAAAAAVGGAGAAGGAGAVGGAGAAAQAQSGGAERPPHLPTRSPGSVCGAGDKGCSLFACTPS